jgi:hypothetical protein
MTDKFPALPPIDPDRIVSAEDLDKMVTAFQEHPEWFKPACPPNCRCQELDP